MAVIRFDPFRELDRWTEQLLGTPAGSARTPRFMPMDLYRSGDHYVLTADLPGVEPGTVDVSVEDGTLTIRAERLSHVEDNVDWLASERSTGTFMRQISLGDGIDAEHIEASYENGCLRVRMPVQAKTQGRRISVDVKGEAPIMLTEGERASVSSR